MYSMNLTPLCNVEETITVLKLFLKTYVKNAKSSSVVLGLSGGIDSAVVAFLCKQVFGNKNTHCFFLPDKATPKNDRKDVLILKNHYDLTVDEYNITNLVDTFVKITNCSDDRLVRANIKARLRMVLLYEHANKTKSLVCGTSNKSELLIGYFTKYGDAGVDLMPLGDVYKTQVWEIAKHLDLPKSIIEKPPTAGLWKGQTDEKELNMSYDVLDQILVGLERKMNVDAIAKAVGIAEKEVERIHQMRVSSQHKRSMPLVPKIGLRTQGLDWRSPVQLG